MKPQPTIRELAALIGCSHTTVALSLRNNPRIPEETRKRIQALAKKHGYRRDPLVSSLMTQLRTTRRVRARPKIALITWWDAPDAWRQNERGKRQHQGILARAHALGYDIEEFWGRAPGMTQTRLGRILHARGIQGIVFLATLTPRGRILFNWKLFAVAAASYTIFRKDVHRSSHNYAQGMTLALRELRHLGYSRVGYASELADEERVNNAWLSAYTGAQYLRHGAIPIPPLLAPTLDPETLGAWCETHRPQVVLGRSDQTLITLRKLGYRVPEDIGFASLDLLSGIETSAGVDQLREAVGARAVELVVEQLENNARGLPEHPKTVMIDGTWCAGATLRRMR